MQKFKNAYYSIRNFCSAFSHIVATTFFRVLTLTCIAMIMQHVSLDLTLFTYDGGTFFPLAGSPWTVFGNPQVTIPAFELTLVQLVALAALGYLFFGIAKLIVFLAPYGFALCKKLVLSIIGAIKGLFKLCNLLWVKVSNWLRRMSSKIKDWMFPTVDKVTQIRK